MIYFDTAYLAKCYLNEPGSEVVRARAAAEGTIACCDLGRAELPAVFHRHLREGSLDVDGHQIVRKQFQSDLGAGVWEWLQLDARVWEMVGQFFEELGPDIFLRGADAVHLAAARVHGLSEIYTNDRHLLAASSALGFSSVNLLGE